MRTENEIKDLAKYLELDHYGERVRQQQTDDDYYTDSWTPALLKPPALDHPTGEAARQIDLPAEHLVTSNPQAFRLARTKNEVESAEKVGKMLNHWLQRINTQTPSPLHLSVKTDLKRGEVFVHQVLNENWKSDNQVGLPVWSELVDPMIVFPWGNEVDGVPDEVFLSCERDTATIQKIWPKFESKDKVVNWLAYWSKTHRYFEADGKQLYNGKNIMGVVPFVHVYSGYGSDSINSKPEELAVGRLRYMRSMLDAERTLFSDSMSLVHRFAYNYFMFMREDDTVPDDALKNFSAEPFNVVLLPRGVKPVVQPADMLANLNYIIQQWTIVKQRLDRELSPLFEGAMIGSSGRQDDMATTNALRRFETIMKGIQTLWSQVLSQCLEIVTNVPDMTPISVYTEDRKGSQLLNEVSVSKEDIKGYFDCSVELKAADVLDADRKAQMWRNSYQTMPISAMTALTKGYNMTADEAQEEIEDWTVDNVTIKNPLWLQAIGLEDAQKRGVPLTELMALAGQTGGQPSGGGRPEEVKTQRGAERVDTGFGRGARRSPGEGA